MKLEFESLQSLPHFYAHALGLEYEFDDRLRDLSGCLRSHNNPDAAAVFSQAERMHAQRLQLVTQKLSGMELPQVAPWHYVWRYSVNLELICMTSLHYLMTPTEAAEMVEDKFQQAQDFYRAVADHFRSQATGNAALELLEVFDAELQQFHRWRMNLSQTPAPTDLDPPNEPY